MKRSNTALEVLAFVVIIAVLLWVIGNGCLTKQHNYTAQESAKQIKDSLWMRRFKSDWLA